MTWGLSSGRLGDIVWSWLEQIFTWDHWKAQPRTCDLSTFPETADELTQLAKWSGPISVTLPQRSALERTVRLPRAAKAKSDQAIALHMKANMPQAGKGLLWKWQLSHETESEATYKCLLIKDAQLQSLLERAKSKGVRIDEIRFAQGFGSPLWQRRKPSEKAAKNWAAATVLLGAVAVLVSVVLSEIRVRDAEGLLAVKSDQVAALRDRLEKFKNQQSEQNLLRQGEAAELSRFIEGQNPLAALTDIATTLPEGVWLSELSFSGLEWRLSGFSTTDAPRVVQILQDMPWVQSVRLDGPISRDIYSAQYRFDLVITAKPKSVN